MFINIWNLVVMVILCWLLIILPLTLSDPRIETDDIKKLNAFCNYVFIADILVNFNSAYYDEYSNIIDDRYNISMSYLFSWFGVDLASSIPLDLIMPLFIDNFSNGNINGLLKFLRLPKYFKLIKIARMSTAIKHIENSVIYKNLQASLGEYFKSLIVLLKSFLFLIVVCHFMSCILIFAMEQDLEGDLETWQTSMFGYNQSVGNLFTSSWYWAIQTVTTVGYGDVATMTLEDLYVKLFSMLVGVVVFTFFIDSMMSMVTMTYKSTDDQNLKDQLETIKQRWQLNGKSLIILEMILAKNKKCICKEEVDMIEKLNDENKKNEVFENIQMNLQYIELFGQVDLNIFKDLYRNLTNSSYAETDYLCYRGDPSELFFFVNQGKVGFREEIMEKYKVLEQGMYNIKDSGEQFCFHDSLFFETYLSDVIAYETCTVFSVPKNAMVTIIDTHDIADMITSIARKELFQYFQCKYATLMVMQQLLELGNHVSTYDIEAFKVLNELEFDYNLMMQIKHMKFVQKHNQTNWWDHILNNPGLSYLINLFSDQQTEIYYRNFNKTLNKIKRCNRVLQKDNLNQFMNIGIEEVFNNNENNYTAKLKEIELRKKAEVTRNYNQIKNFNLTREKIKLTKENANVESIRLLETDMHHRFLKLSMEVDKELKKEEEIEEQKITKNLSVFFEEDSGNRYSNKFYQSNSNSSHMYMKHNSSGKINRSEIKVTDLDLEIQNSSNNEDNMILDYKEMNINSKLMSI